MTLDQSGQEFLHTPGPTQIPDRVREAMSRQSLDLMDSRLRDMTGSCFADMKQIFKTGGEVFIYSANGHGAWEAALANLFAPGDVVLLPETGVFSNAWAAQAKALGLEARLIPGDWRRAADPARLEETLRADSKGEIKGVLLVQTDTATSITCDVPAMRRAMDAAGHPALLVVDTVASLAAHPYDMDAWGVNVTIGASQKALMGPPGMAILAVDERALRHAKQSGLARNYWDWHARLGGEFYMRFCGTPPEQHIFALRAALDLIFEETLEGVLSRHRRLAGAVHRAVEAWSEAGAVSFNALEPGERAVSVTTVRLGEGHDPDQLRRFLREELGVSLAGGLGDLSGKAFRIGHMGSVNEPMILGCLATIETAMLQLGIPHESGLRAAAEHIAEARGKQMLGPARAA